MKAEFATVELRSARSRTVIGVIAWRDAERTFRALGWNRESGTLDESLFRAVAGKHVRSTWVFSEWVNWMRSLVTDWSISASAFQRELANLDTLGDIRLGDVRSLVVDAPLHQVADSLAAQLLPRVTPRPVLMQDILVRVHDSLEFLEGQQPYYSISIEFDGRPSTNRHYLDLFVDGNPRSALIGIDPYSRHEEFVRAAKEANRTIKAIIRHSLIEPSMCIVASTEALISSLPFAFPKGVRVLDPYAANFPERVRQIVRGKH